MGSTRESYCWVTLVTKPSYLPGVLILAYTLSKHKSKYPLIVQYTSSLGDDAERTLQAEADAGGRIKPEKVELLLPRAGQENTSSVAERFKDTFTKLRAFEVYKLGYTKAVFLDADMAIFQNPDAIFDTQFPARDWLGTNHACVCNLDHDSWAPDTWNKGNCAFTRLTDPHSIAPQPTSKSRPTYHLLNGGLLIFYPTQSLWNDMLTFFNTTDRLKTYQFPDQDFLADYFRNKWQPLSWKYNALKTMRYWHPKMWSDDVVVVVHYIVDKPWERQVSPDGVAGHLGRDGETHRWWWELYREWVKTKNGSEAGEKVLQAMTGLVDTQEPFIKRVPLPQEPGRPEDVKDDDGEI